MKNTIIDYPHPVLNEYLKDFTESSFSITDPVTNEDINNIILKVAYILNCEGIVNLISNGTLEVKLRITCSKTSYRAIFPLYDRETEITLPKNKLADEIELQAFIIASDSYSSYKLPEFNSKYFGNLSFSLRKGDIVAIEPGVTIKLQTVNEGDAKSVVLVTMDNRIESLKIHYSSMENNNSENENILTDYIYICLPSKQYDIYKKLNQKKYFKFGIKRFLQASIILPAIVEGISLLKYEDSVDETNGNALESHYKDTLWGSAFLSALKKANVDDLQTATTSYELANIILNDVAKDSLNDLMQKMTDWTNTSTGEL